MKILFVYNTKTTFTKQDFDILSSHFEVKDVLVDSYAKSFYFAFPWKIWEYDLVYLWFSSLNFFPIFLISKILRKKIVIVAGGFDVANVPELAYGGGCDPLPLKLFRKFMLRGASVVVCVSQSNQKDFFKMIEFNRPNNVVIPYGFHSTNGAIKLFHERRQRVITVGAVNEVTFERKGFRYFAELSRIMPNWEFVIVGKSDEIYREKLKTIGGPNLQQLGYLDDAAFHEVLLDSRFYLQLSHHEAFGVSVVDAGLCGVMPIVFNSFALPEITENIGVSVAFGDLQGVKSEIVRLATNGYDPLEIKNKFLKKFPWEKKENSLVRLIQSILH